MDDNNQQPYQQYWQQPQQQQPQQQPAYQAQQQQYRQPAYQAQQQQYQQPAYQAQQQQYQQPVYQAPAQQLPTDRNVVVVVLLSLITFGIYSLVLHCKLSREINLTAKADGQQTMHYIGALLLGLITFGIYTLVWTHKYCERVGAEAARRNTGVQFGAADFWIFSVLLSFTVICPFIYLHKLITAANAINTSYNYYG